jgi:flagellar assembly protein FliH
MSSSRAPKVIIGSTGSSLDESSLESFTSRNTGVRAWDPRMEEEYWRRVRDKAQAMAADIVVRARAEAEVLRAQASKEGYAEGAGRAEATCSARLEELGRVFASSLAAVESQSRRIWKGQSQDIVALVRIAVEKTLRIELDARRGDVLASLLDQALDMVDSRTGFTVLVNPADEPLMAELLAAARAARTGPGTLERWQVKTSRDIAPGGLILESDHGMVDNTVPCRFADVAKLLDQLDVSFDEGPEPPDDPETVDGAVGQGTGP